jgi:hypothetical protein
MEHHPVRRPRIRFDVYERVSLPAGPVRGLVRRRRPDRKPSPEEGEHGQAGAARVNRRGGRLARVRVAGVAAEGDGDDALMKEQPRRLVEAAEIELGRRLERRGA